MRCKPGWVQGHYQRCRLGGKYQAKAKNYGPIGQSIKIPIATAKSSNCISCSFYLRRIKEISIKEKRRKKEHRRYHDIFRAFKAAQNVEAGGKFVLRRATVPAEQHPYLLITVITVEYTKP